MIYIFLNYNVKCTRDRCCITAVNLLILQIHSFEVSRNGDVKPKAINHCVHLDFNTQIHRSKNRHFISTH